MKNKKVGKIKAQFIPALKRGISLRGFDERTLTADKILFGDNVTCEKGSGLTGKEPRIIVFIIHHQCQMIFLKLIVV